MSDSLLAAGKPFRPGRAGVILKIYLLNKVVLVHIFGGGPVYMARTKQPDVVIYPKFSSGYPI
jgi:hypothetical protein